MAGIYVHIPFCHSKCAYCDFYSTPNLSSCSELVDAIIAEAALRADEVAEPITTLYLGGGTPSILPESLLRRLVGSLPSADIQEFTMEVNPEDVNPHSVAMWRSLGINRISMGIQSLDDTQLQLIGRRHSAEQAIHAVHTLRDGGITNLSLDLIYALPAQSIDSWRESLTGVLALRPEHLSAYMLSYEPRTRLTAMLNAGKIVAVDEDTAVDMYSVLIDAARAHGYEHYEISNFALPGYRSKHNSSYWQSIPYVGLGPAAHSFDGKHRRFNPSDIKSYVNDLKAGRVAYEVEHESRAERFNDLLITRLRTAEGLDFASVPVPRRLKLFTDAYPFMRRGEIVLVDNHLRIPERSWLVSDAIMRDLIQ